MSNVVTKITYYQINVVFNNVLVPTRVKDPINISKIRPYLLFLCVFAGVATGRVMSGFNQQILICGSLKACDIGCNMTALAMPVINTENMTLLYHYTIMNTNARTWHLP